MRVRQPFTRRVPLPRSWRLASARHRASGQVMIIFALASLVLVGFVALSVDTGFLMAEKRQTQSAADAAALAGAKALFDGKTDQVVSDAKAYGAENAEVTQDAVIVNSPPLTGTYAGNKDYVHVTITKNVDKYFLGALYSGNWSVSASAVAGIEPQGADYALITLEDKDEPGIYLNGNTGIILLGSDDEGNGASAMSNTNIRGSNNTTFQTPGTIDANTTIQSGNKWTETRTGQPQVDDPLAWMSPPSASTLTARSFADQCKKSPCELSPGKYIGQSFTVDGKVTLKPGVYFFENTSIGMKNKGLLTGNGVTLYFGSGAAVDPKNGSIVLTGPQSAPWSNAVPRLVFWHSTCTNLDLQGNGDTTFNGVFYAPCANVSMHGNPSNDTIDGQMFIGTLEVKGTSDLKIRYRSYVDTERKRVFLIE